MFEALFQEILRKEDFNQEDATQLLIQIVANIRPRSLSNLNDAINAIHALCYTLNQHPDYLRLLRDAILLLVQQKKSVSLFADAGIPSNMGFFAELLRRLTHKILPDVIDSQYLKDTFSQMFNYAFDCEWVEAIPDDVWLALFHHLKFKQADIALKNSAQLALVEALQVLSYRVSASGLEPELIKNHEDLENYASPFITQNLELRAYLTAENIHDADVKHVRVMLDQCQQVVLRVRKSCEQKGTSIQLTALLQRISQQLNRLNLLFNMVAGIQIHQKIELHCVHLLKTLVYAECNKNNLRSHWRENMELVALRVTENAGHSGEHYIASNRAQYFELMRSAMGAGVVIAFMAMIKINITSLHLAPLMETILISFNYAIGFVLIHILHFTVATKQPAMTAATIAATIDESDGKVKSLDKLINIVAQTSSSQTVAILGNVLVVIPLVFIIDLLIHYFTGHHYIGVEKAQSLLNGNNPLTSGSVVFAMVAGVCLFLAGLIAGYHDNVSAYNKIPERIAALGWLQKCIGKQFLYKVSNYIQGNLGALAGNFYFGFLLGITSGLGVMLGLPIDIRHVTFVSAFFGFATAALDYQLTHYMLYTAILGIILVAMMNLFTSFFLALYVAMKSRKVRFEHWRLFAKTLLSRLNQHPNQFFLPPKK